jgi:hypothetical protein
LYCRDRPLTTMPGRATGRPPSQAMRRDRITLPFLAAHAIVRR